jgi:hypothetical protein
MSSHASAYRLPRDPSYGSTRESRGHLLSLSTYRELFTVPVLRIVSVEDWARSSSWPQMATRSGKICSATGGLDAAALFAKCTAEMWLICDWYAIDNELVKETGNMGVFDIVKRELSLEYVLHRGIEEILPRHNKMCWLTLILISSQNIGSGCGDERV